MILFGRYKSLGCEARVYGDGDDVMPSSYIVKVEWENHSGRDYSISIKPGNADATVVPLADETEGFQTMTVENISVVIEFK